MNAFPRIQVAGEASALVYVGDQLSPQNLALVQTVVTQLHNQSPAWLVDFIPSYTSLLVEFDPLQTDLYAVQRYLRKLLQQPQQQASRSASLIELPVCYEPSLAPDLSDVAAQTGLDQQALVDCHSQQRYRVYAIGFAPGFAYLGELHQALALPRKAKPRLKVPQGSVAIADRQTAIYPSVSPGGWHLIGRCPLKLFDPNRQQPSLFTVGDEVAFKPITSAEFERLREYPL